MFDKSFVLFLHLEALIRNISAISTCSEAIPSIYFQISTKTPNSDRMKVRPCQKNAQTIKNEKGNDALSNLLSSSHFVGVATGMWSIKVSIFILYIVSNAASKINLVLRYFAMRNERMDSKSFQSHLGCCGTLHTAVQAVFQDISWVHPPHPFAECRQHRQNSYYNDSSSNFNGVFYHGIQFNGVFYHGNGPIFLIKILNFTMKLHETYQHFLLRAMTQLMKITQAVRAISS